LVRPIPFRFINSLQIFSLFIWGEKEEKWNKKKELEKFNALAKFSFAIIFVE
jgi:hypothetical protein